MTASMSGKRFAHIIKTLGWSKRGAAHFFGVSDRTVLRWEEDEHIPRPIAMVLGLMIEKKLEPMEVLVLGGVRPAQIDFIIANLYGDPDGRGRPA